MKTKLNSQWMVCVASGLVGLAAVNLLAAEYEGNLEQAFSVAPGGKLVMQADRGSIDVTTDAGDKAQVRVLRKVKGGSQAQAEALLAEHQVTLQQEGNTISAVARNKSKVSWSWRPGQPVLTVHYQVNIPRKFEVELQTAGGDIRLGDLEGDALARTTSGSIRLGAVTGKVEARDSGGDIVIANAGSSVVAHTTSGSINIQTLNGRLEAKNSGGDINVGQAGGDVTAETTSGTIKVKSAKGRLDARNSGGNVVLGETGGEAAVRTTSGSISIGLAKGKVEARNSGGDIKVTDARDLVTATTTSGTISVAFSACPKAECRLEVAGGGINVTLPANAALNLDAQSSGGQVVTAMPVTVTGQDGRKTGSLKGQLNGGGPGLWLRASSGDIRVKPSAAVPKGGEVEQPEK
jgi:DUF4097 and DUF4098 domain-containing protein YvlB